MDTTQIKAAAPSSRQRYATSVKIWLLIGLFMIFMQVVIGGITRLTGSGLSITRWEIVMGTLPPLNAGEWHEAFDLYKATPQYQKINQGMTMGEFKFIFFWEYFHRLWARLMGFVFLLPFAYFYIRRRFDRMLMRRLVVVFLLAGVVASFGWIMVASGLVDRPWVNAYKLTMHLSLALVLFGYLLWTTFKVIQPAPKVFHNALLKKGALTLFILVAIQIILGGIMSGMKAALFFPTWPDLNGQFVPSILLDASQWTVENMARYDASLFAPALIQMLHRTVAYILIIMSLWYFFRGLRLPAPRLFHLGLYVLITLLVIQATLGVLTVVNSVGVVPVGLGVFHQAVAILVLSAVLFLYYQFAGQKE